MDKRHEVTKIRREMLKKICDIKKSFFDNKVKREMYEDLLMIDEIYRLGFKNILINEISKL